MPSYRGASQIIARRRGTNEVLQRWRGSNFVWSRTDPVVVKNGLVGYWPTNDGSGTTVRDAINGANASFVGSMQWAAGPKGVPGTAIQATADGSRAEVPHASVPVVSTAITISCWWKPTQTAPWHSLVSKHVQDDVVPYTMYYLNGGADSGTKFRLSVNVDNTLVGTNAATITLNQWHHIVGKWSSGNPIQCYSDGALLNQTGPYSGSITNYTSALAFCGHGQIATRWARGPVSMIRLYNRDISTSEIAEIYNHEGPPV